MKKITILFAALLLFTINSYSQNTDVKALLDKSETRTEVFNTILNDHQLMMEFMKEMKGNQHAMMMMKENNRMMKKDGNMEMDQKHQMMNHDKMRSMMNENPEMMQKMMGNMMEMCEKDSTMCSKMTDMIVQHPELMKAIMQKLNSKSTPEIEDSTMNHMHQH